MPPLTPGQTATLGEIGPKEFDFLATRYAFGDKSVLSGAGRGDRKSRAFNKALQGRAADFWMAKGMGPEDAMKAQLEFGGMAKGSQVIAQLDARMTVAIEKARATAPVVLDAAKKINRTDFPAMNELILNWDEHTGDPNVPPFFIALETLANNYGSALGMGNSVLTDSRVQHARDLIKRSWASGQLESGVGQMLNELNREQKATRQSMHVFLSSSNLGGEKKSQETLTDDDLDNMSIEELQELRKRGR
jgi:hypothetical protein